MDADYSITMNVISVLLATMSILVSLTPSDLKAQEPRSEGFGHCWRSISYPKSHLFDSLGDVYFTIRNSDPSIGLRLDMYFETPASEVLATLLDRIQLRVKPEFGEMRAHLQESSMLIGQGAGFGNAEHTFYTLTTYFPWIEASLEAGWISVEFEGEGLLLAVPFGFLEDPSRPFEKSEADHKRSIGSPPRSELERDEILEWKSVHYELGEVSESRKLFVNQLNSNGATSDIILYRERGDSKQWFMWKADKPVTELLIREYDGTEILPKKAEVEILKDGLRRSDKFKFTNSLLPKRTWARAIISIDKVEYVFRLASSVYR